MCESKNHRVFLPGKFYSRGRGIIYICIYILHNYPDKDGETGQHLYLMFRVGVLP